MREPNFSTPSQNKAAVVITSALYDRRALDCTATLPLVSSLTNLVYMTSTNSRIRDILTADGGLERLVKILATCQNTDKITLWKWSLAFQCIVNVGVRGTEAIRSRVVEAGAVDIILAILENFTSALDQAKSEKDQQQQQQQQQTALCLPIMPTSNINEAVIMTTATTTNSFLIPKRHTFLKRSVRQKQKQYTVSLSAIPLLKNLSTDAILHREEDILLSLQLLAYLSKYPSIRQAFHSNYHKNVFSVVEKFTHRIHPAAIIYWAGVIMRNACRKDDARGGVRQCANMQCGKWERFPREFAKCRRCRKAKYCSKSCQSRAWADGHRWWCIERPHSSHPPNAAATSSTAVAAAAAIAAAAPPPQPPADQVVHLEDNVTSDVLAIPIENAPQQQQQETAANQMRRSSIVSNNENNNLTTRPRDESLLFYHHPQRRNSRLLRTLASSSSTDVEAEVTDNSHDRPRDLMDVD